MRKLKALFTLLALSWIGIFAQNNDFKLVWADEFDSNVINTENWNFETGGNGWGNQELQYYTDRTDNAFIRDGKLVIKAKKEVFGNREYTSARLTTKDKTFVKYGKIEAYIKLPVGAGTWPAFWMMPQNSVYGSWPRSGEIDIMEHVGSDPEMVSFATHTRNANGGSGNNWYSQIRQANIENEFHLYSIEWLDDRIVFYVDNVKQATFWNDLLGDYKSWPFDQEFYVILNLALGGKMGGNINDNIFNSDIEMEIDYVRIYQKGGQSSLSEDNLSESKVVVDKNSTSITVSGINAETSVNLYSIEGRLLIGNNPVDISKCAIDVSSLKAGVYILTIANNGKIRSHKIMLQ